ncbi:MAG TPA: NAD(P)H-binding protein [Sphingomonadaceae bacterium]|jgi:uncharacterized protein YbjT (DUF2867 family)|nr:NAD(P)H-binding protein [Sphingomonadaceae bacterium]
MRVAMIGATGLVGSLLADRLFADPRTGEVHSIGRRESGRRGVRWREHVAPAADWPDIARAVAAEVAVSALGTTMRAAGSEAAFRAVDRDIVAAFARATREAGARRMLTISSVGADAASRDFYLRTKGEMERELRALSFARLDVLRPGLLRGARGGDRRLGERIGIALSALANLALRGRFARYAAIDAAVVADAAAACLHFEAPGVFVHENGDIRRLARELTG